MYSPEVVELYDRIYRNRKDYSKEAGEIRELLRKTSPDARTLLDVACGSAEHARFLRDWFTVDGLDQSEEFLELARRKNPGLKFHVGNMIDFDLGQKFDTIIMLFSSIGYVRTLENLHRSVECLNRHLNHGGTMLVEPWFTPDSWEAGRIHTLQFEEPCLNVFRMHASETVNGCSRFVWHYLVGKEGKVEHFTDEHILGLFTKDHMLDAFARCGLQVSYDELGISGRGLYVAHKA